MKLDEVRTIAVMGAGLMGSQIAEIISRVGKFNVLSWDLEQKLVNDGVKSIQTRLTKFFVEKGKMTKPEFEEVMGRIKTTTSVEEAARSGDFIIECVVENLKIKQDIFTQLGEKTGEKATMASNTSYLNITEVAKAAKNPGRVIGMHFFNPVAMMKLVEIVKGPLTQEDSVELGCSLAKALGKEPVICKDFSFGFLANRAYSSMVEEATRMVWERVASPQEIDKALKLGYNLPLGPLELRDMTGGWGIAVSSEEDRIKALGERGRVHPLAKLMVRAGYTGGRTEKGIYAFWEDVLSKW